MSMYNTGTCSERDHLQYDTMMSRKKYQENDHFNQLSKINLVKELNREKDRLFCILVTVSWYSGYH